MNKKVLATTGVVIVIAGGVGLWWMNSRKSVSEPTSPLSSTPAVTQPVPVVVYTPVEQYQQELASIKLEYEASTSAVGVTTQARVEKRQEWLTALQKTLERVMRLSVPEESREIHQNRIIAIYALVEALQGTSVTIASVTQYETAIVALWK